MRSVTYVDIAQKACTLLPKAELQIIPGVGHTLHLEDEAATWGVMGEGKYNSLNSNKQYYHASVV